MPGPRLRGRTPFNPNLTGPETGGVLIHSPRNAQAPEHSSVARKAQVIIVAHLRGIMTHHKSLHRPRLGDPTHRKTLRLRNLHRSRLGDLTHHL
jgi:hypothetical protein